MNGKKRAKVQYSLCSCHLKSTKSDLSIISKTMKDMEIALHVNVSLYINGIRAICLYFF